MTRIASGIDLVKINRLRTLDSGFKARFIQRVFTTREMEVCGDRDDSLAGRFAAKEAAAKALGCGIGEVGWKDIETLEDECGRPELYLHRSAQERAESLGWTSWSISISHTSDYAVAMVTALVEGD
jgi:holo-[acyl-carrier protein] synthase